MNTVAQRRNKDVLAYLDLVTPIARHYSRASGQDHDDLIQVGRLGLLKAAQHCNTRLSDKFKAYAKAHIRGAILHYLRDSSALMRLPRTLQERAQRLHRRTNSEGSKRQELTAEESLVMATYRQQSQWTAYDERIDLTWSSQHSDWTRLLQSDQRMTVMRCLKELPQKERACIEAVVMEGASLRETAKRLNISAMTVQRRVKHGLQSLADQCRQQGLEAGCVSWSALSRG